MSTRRGSRPDAAINSDQARDKSTILPPNSQPFPSENSLTNTTQSGDVDGPEAYSESPAEHVRNALQLLSHGERSPLGYPGHVLFAGADVDAIVARLKRALEQLEAPGYDWQYRAGLDVFELASPDAIRCVHCGCTDVEACTLDVAQLSATDRRAITEYFAECGTQPLGDRVQCWWISYQPPVCSAPHCAELHRAATVGVTS